MEKSNPSVSDSIPFMCKANKVKFIFYDTRTIVTIVVLVQTNLHIVTDVVNHVPLMLQVIFKLNQI